MSDQLRIAGALRKLSDSQLVALATKRNINTTNLRDFFDFAEQLANEKSVRQSLATLPIDVLKQIWQGYDRKPLQSASPLLEQQLLLDPSNSTIFEVVEKVSRDLEVLQPHSAPVAVSDLSIEEIDRDARMHIFEILQAVTEVVLDLEQRFIREVGKRSIGLPEVKRLASHLSKDVAYARTVFEVTLWSQVATIENGRWQLGPKAELWLSSNDEQRWLLLAESWLKTADPHSLVNAGTKPASVQTLKPQQNFAEHYPASYLQQMPETETHVETVVRLAEAIGLTSQNCATTWFAAMDRQGLKAAASLMATGLPHTEKRLIVQADLSLIAPNPLPTDIEIELRNFVETEKIGLASSYRLSALSVSNGLECGLTIARIRALLEELSGKALPQPVEYLLADAERKFGKLRISLDHASGRSQVSGEDRVMLTQLYNDVKLKPLSLHFNEDGLLVSRFEPDVVYFAIREAGYVVVRVDSNDHVLSPKRIATPQNAEDPTLRVLEDIRRMRSADEKIGTSPDDGDLVRQLQLAIKLKTKINVTLDLGGGKQVSYLVEPTGLSNGRLRAKDRKADVERTLPLSAITSIELQ